MSRVGKRDNTSQVVTKRRHVNTSGTTSTSTSTINNDGHPSATQPRPRMGLEQEKMGHARCLGPKRSAWLRLGPR
jgi:hypothetical protein